MRKHFWKKSVATFVASVMLLSGLTAGISTPIFADDVKGYIAVDKLQVQYMENPIGLDLETPVFGWQMDSNVIAQKQTAYQIVVRDEADVVWDSGIIYSNESVHIPYEGDALSGSTRYTWNVTVWDKYGNTAVSDNAYFETGLMDLGWSNANWIKPGVTSNDVAPMFRREFTTKSKSVKSAQLYASAAGIYEMYINGSKVGDGYFNPGWTDYMDYVSYQTYDVTHMINENGGNAIGAMLGEGWYSGKVASFGEDRYGADEDMALMAKLVITYEDNDQDILVTDSDWDYTINGPIRENNFLDGEKYDARYEKYGWDQPGYALDSDWSPVSASGVSPVNIGELKAHVGNYVTVVDTITPAEPYKVTRMDGEEVFIYDFGQNFAGIASIKITGEEGDTISLRFGETINDADYPDRGCDDLEGTLYDANLRTFQAIDTYTLKGDPDGEIYTPRFTFHGFRYMELSGVDQALPVSDVVGLVLSNVDQLESSYETSNADINQLYSNAVWSQISNFLSVPTDCPQRDERMGWTGDAQIFARTATYNYNSDQFFTHFMNVLNTSTDDEGHVPGVAPSKNIFMYGVSSNGWGDAATIIPWNVYQQYGDTTIIEDNYELMTRYVGYLLNETDGKGNGVLGDWLCIEGNSTPTALTNQGFVAYSTELLSKMAAVIGKDDDAKTYHEAAEAVKAEWRDTYMTADGGLTTDTQTAYLVALQFELVKENQREKIVELLRQNLAENDNHLTVGFVGVSYLCPILSAVGSGDIAYTLFENTTYPSWLYSVQQGATTIWERWNSYTLESGFGPVSMNSFNHYSYGSIEEWMMRYSLGIERDESAPGYKKIILQPTSGGSLDYANGHYNSIYGTIESGWTADGSTMANYSATVPANTTATLYLPVDIADDSLNKVPGITFKKITEHNGETVAEIELKSGGYEFTMDENGVTARVADGYVADTGSNKTTLSRVIIRAEELMKTDEYETVIDDVKESFTAALSYAKGVYEDPNATQEEIGQAVKALIKEIRKLGFQKGDITELGWLISIAQEIEDELDLHVLAGQDVFLAALRAAESLYADKANAMADDVEEVYDALLEAMTNLRYRANKDVLNQVVTEALSVNTANYTATSVTVFQKALSNAVELLENNELSEDDQETVDKAAEELRAAMRGLVPLDSSNGSSDSEPDDSDSSAAPDSDSDSDSSAAPGTDSGSDSSGGKSGTTVPKTGDAAPLAGFSVMLILAGLIVAVARRKKA